MSVLVVFASLLAASSPAAAARSLQQTINAAMIQNVLNAYEKDPTQTATQLASSKPCLPLYILVYLLTCTVKINTRIPVLACMRQLQ